MGQRTTATEGMAKGTRSQPTASRTASNQESGLTARNEQPHNNRMKLPAPLGGRAGNGGVIAAASCSPFGSHRRRSLSGCWTDIEVSERE